MADDISIHHRLADQIEALFEAQTSNRDRLTELYKLTIEVRMLHGSGPAEGLILAVAGNLSHSHTVMIKRECNMDEVHRRAVSLAKSVRPLPVHALRTRLIGTAQCGPVEFVESTGEKND